MVKSVALACVALAGCGAFADYASYQFAHDGGAQDLATDDAALRHFGEPCAGIGCVPGAGAPWGRPLVCVTDIGAVSFPSGGMCTRACDPLALNACGDYGPGVARCGEITAIFVCLPACDATGIVGCRPNYQCCLGGGAAAGPGMCSPPTSRECGH